MTQAPSTDIKGSRRSAAAGLERDGAIATVVLNRPAKLNAFTLQMWAAARRRIPPAFR
ncbi:hypothetical protein ACU4GD_09305 [Cupriavidus basilensis]